MEIWKKVKDYENYQVSNLGNVKSLNYNRTGKEKILKHSFGSNGYLHVVLCKNGKTKTFNIHQLVAISFLNHIPCGYNLVVNHKDFNRRNNKVDNLEVITTRENANQKHLKSTSQYTGVSWDKNKNKWLSQIHINRKSKKIGYFTSELEASNAYQKHLELLKN